MQFIQIVPADKPRKHVFIGMGASEGTIEVPCVAALFASASLLRAAGLTVTLCIEAGNCHVDDMRNSIVASFLESDADELIFIDEDVGFLAPDLLKLIEHDRDVVGGVYPKKEDAPNFPVYVNPGVDLWADADGLVEVHGLPTGFLKFKRHVLQALWDRSAKWTGSDGREYRQVFERVIEGGVKWSHDYAVCRKWGKLGGKCFADPYFVMSHTGKKTWVGDLAAYWREKHGVEGQERAAKLKWGVDQLRAGNASQDVFEALCMGWNNEWAAEPEMLADVWARATGKVLECGSGLTTLVLAIKGVDSTILEHDPAFASHTRKMLALFGIEVDIQITPLVGGWYDYAGGKFDTVIVDGPPRALGDRDEVFARIQAPLWIIDDMGGEPRHRVREMELA